MDEQIYIRCRRERRAAHRARIALAGIIVLLLVLTGLPSAMAESEPNDTPAQALSIGVGYTNAVVGASISAITDLDYYTFSAQAGQTFVIETFNVAGTGGTKLTLYNDSGTVLANSQAGTGTANRRIIFTFAVSGTYFIQVASASYSNWTGSYSLRVLPKYDQAGAAWDAAKDLEPNDVPELANALSVGLSNAVSHQIVDNAGLISGDGDQDYYRFSAKAGQTFVIETFNVTGTGGTSLILSNDSGTTLATGQMGTGNVNRRIVFSITADGTYFLKVARANYTSWTGTYTLRVLPKYDQAGAAWDAAKDLEPNDVPELANVLSVGLSNAVSHQIVDNAGLISGDGDQDYYRFSAKAGQTFVIETFNVTGTGGTSLILSNDSGTTLATGQMGTGNVNRRIVFSITADGTYFLKVARADYTSWKGTYTLRVLPKYDQAGAAWDAAKDYEPNDVPELANAISIGASNAISRQITAKGSLVGGDDDQDYYRFSAQAGQSLVIETFNVAGTGGTGITLLNDAGTVLATGKTGSGAVNRTIAFTFTSSGTYFLKVAHADYTSWTGTYTLRVCDGSCTLRVHVPYIRR
ncbi:PPC domain-containing protein [Oscillochloris sp. ZM17-4]|uniref:PPC domain-containing protein n=1 Tax=Oscillochloris sp. ZM17-4 TaxID=2866714 RepID=UPI001C7306E4|nr:PPC domain-containing protein [Oscillochloris sp. ZM17-4]MBX0326090.1 PPC domain-containing protein [Oscillochloris sp. ZM17-4]